MVTTGPLLTSRPDSYANPPSSPCSPHSTQHRDLCRTRSRPGDYPAQTPLWLPTGPRTAQTPTLAHKALGLRPLVASLPLHATDCPSPQLWGPPSTLQCPNSSCCPHACCPHTRELPPRKSAHSYRSQLTVTSPGEPANHSQRPLPLLFRQRALYSRYLWNSLSSGCLLSNSKSSKKQTPATNQQ